MSSRDPRLGAYMIGVVSMRYGVHPQTLRLYEREGLLTPSRTEGKTRLYSDEDLERLEFILNLTRDLGVNLAGVDVVLGMRDRLNHLQEELERLAHALGTSRGAGRIPQFRRAGRHDRLPLRSGGSPHAPAFQCRHLRPTDCASADFLWRCPRSLDRLLC